MIDKYITQLASATCVFAKVLILMLVLSACRHTNYSSDLTEGVIEYKITYLESSLSTVSPALLPKKMIQKFKQNKSSNSIEGFMGMFALTNISDSRKHTNTTLLKVMDNRFRFSGSPGESGCCFEPFDGMNIQYIDSQRVIAGYHCTKALATFPGINKDTIELWFTHEIGVGHPNITNPFSEIDGVLMQFNLNLKKLRMRFTAEQVKKENISWSDFDIPESFRPVSRQKMEKIISALME